MNIALIGFMGSGKTSVGAHIARALKYRFLDTDALIVRETKTSITRLFEQKGEGYFRMLERKILTSIHLLDRYVIATGGGMPAQTAAMDLLKKAALVVFLRPQNPNLLLGRLRGNEDRPMLNQKDSQWEEDALALYAKRLFFYEQAHLVVYCQHRNVTEISRLVLQKIARHEGG